MTEKAQSANVALTGPELSQIRALIEERSGIHFDPARHPKFPAAVRQHMAARKITQTANLVRVLRDSRLECDEFLEALLKQDSCFAQNPSVYAALEKVLGEIHQKKFWETPRSLRIWSAGCGSGEEPYSIAMTIGESLEFAGAWNIHILATDISRSALEQAERGLFPPRSVASLGPRLKENYFTRVNDQYLVRPQVRNMVSFAQMNLVQNVYMGRFDIIFCVDVLSYLGENHRAALLRRFYEYLESGGYLFLGSREPMARMAAKFETVTSDGCVLYQKPVAPKSNKAPHGAVHRPGRAEREKKA